MNLLTKSHHLSWCLSSLAGLAVGCVLAADVDQSKECAGENTNSVLDGDQCYCEAMYEWCNPDIDDDYTCCLFDSGECNNGSTKNVNGEELCCSVGYDWCSSEPDDARCCWQGGGHETGQDTSGDVGSETGTGGTDTGGSSEDAGGTTAPPPETCDQVGTHWCTHSEAEGSQGSQYYACNGSEWVEDPTWADTQCQGEGYDFGYGCVTKSDGVYADCGNGPGTACSNEAAACNNTDVIEFCKNGRLSQDSCNVSCTEVGDGTATYDYGECGEQDGVIECLCCDFDEPECGNGGSEGSSSGASSSDGGTSDGSSSGTGG